MKVSSVRYETERDGENVIPTREYIERGQESNVTKQEL